jgi:hypothetical protein
MASLLCCRVPAASSCMRYSAYAHVRLVPPHGAEWHGAQLLQPLTSVLHYSNC